VTSLNSTSSDGRGPISGSHFVGQVCARVFYCDRKIKVYGLPDAD